MRKLSHVCLVYPFYNNHIWICGGRYDDNWFSITRVHTIHMITQHNEGNRRSKKKMYQSRNNSKNTIGQASQEGVRSGRRTALLMKYNYTESVRFTIKYMNKYRSSVNVSKVYTFGTVF